MDALTVTVRAAGSKISLLACPCKGNQQFLQLHVLFFVFSESRLLKIDFLRLTTGRLAAAGASAAGATDVAGVGAESPIEL